MSIPAGNLTQPIFQTTPTRAGGRELGEQDISSLLGPTRQGPRFRETGFRNLSEQPGGLADLVNFAPNLTPGEADAIRSRFAPQDDMRGTGRMFPELLGSLAPFGAGFQGQQSFGSNSPAPITNTVQTSLLNPQPTNPQPTQPQESTQPDIFNRTKFGNLGF